MHKILILGANGMLGTAVLRAFSNARFHVIVTTRQIQLNKALNHIRYDAAAQSFDDIARGLPSIDLVINCIGIIKQKNRHDDSTSTERMFRVNSEFPSEIIAASTKYDFKVLTIATDCVFSGREGNYSEVSQHDPCDSYGHSKSRGEIKHNNLMTLRTSIIGPDDPTNASLHNWLTSQPYLTEIPGYTDHLWNGVTTHAFSKVAVGVASMHKFHSGTFHLTPEDAISKYELLKLIAAKRNRADLKIIPQKSSNPIDRRLVTVHPSINAELWQKAGYVNAPKIVELIEEML